MSSGEPSATIDTWRLVPKASIFPASLTADHPCKPMSSGKRNSPRRAPESAHSNLSQDVGGLDPHWRGRFFEVNLRLHRDLLPGISPSFARIVEPDRTPPRRRRKDTPPARCTASSVPQSSRPMACREGVWNRSASQFGGNVVDR
jgi:hypothetical protein